jgi:REP element-mobilizing transposase RayT/uncharacterized membrane protein
MPRLPRIYIEGALYYVTCRGEHEHKLFKQKEDYQMYLELLKRYHKEYGFKLFAWGLLPNHIHLLIQPKEKHTISEIMHVLNSSYSKYYNNTYQRKGHLFRERFKACIVEKEPYLARLTSYIHLNPQKLGLADNPQDYPYSSYGLYADIDREDFQEEINEVLSFLGGENYADYTKRMTNVSSLDLHKRLQRRGILGSREFIQKTREIIRQKENELKTQEAPRIKRVLLVASIGLGVVVVGIVAGVTYYYIALRTAKPEPPTPAPLTILEHALKSTIELDSTEWQVNVSSRDGATYTDTLTFVNKKIISAHFSRQGFRATNYSITKKGDKIIWETIQTFGYTSVSWRGEIQGTNMRGIISLRTPGETQDFSFVSIKYRGKE